MSQSQSMSKSSSSSKASKRNTHGSESRSSSGWGNSLNLSPRRSDSPGRSSTRRRTSVTSVANTRRTSGFEDPLGIGKESESAAPPSRWVLVLGGTSTGKTALIRELKCTYDEQDEAEAVRYQKEVHKVALDAFKELLKSVTGFPPDLQLVASKILGLKRRASFTPDLVKDLKTLWAAEVVQEALLLLPHPHARQASRPHIPPPHSTPPRSHNEASAKLPHAPALPSDFGAWNTRRPARTSRTASTSSSRMATCLPKRTCSTCR